MEWARVIGRVEMTARRTEGSKRGVRADLDMHPDDERQAQADLEMRRNDNGEVT